MKAIIKILAISFLSILLNSCSNEINTIELSGTWKSQDGASISLNEDGTFTGKKINFFYISDDDLFKNRTIDISGKWHIGKSGNQKVKTVQLISNTRYKDFGIDKTYIDKNGVQQSYTINCSFEVSGSGLLSNKPPYYLSVNIGDPDDFNMYKFEKL
ncbi:hypothetical protein IRZ71_05765 [Flavobacterium sp. ANB]|uniref:hypothetical protein n=1 Tax=unclassified Flavobacterium TaxID=196869 RepID=UPI0012B7FAE3|nr:MULTISPECIES: hypothetical protein [unclassified Flavobacterium]MBF4515837.1 hypothetical protein [Flavobacterium sp. ANB]MTD68839.1 hypothetical protein [Flavobacterium sp. LC2016-13]